MTDRFTSGLFSPGLTNGTGYTKMPWSPGDSLRLRVELDADDPAGLDDHRPDHGVGLDATGGAEREPGQSTISDTPSRIAAAIRAWANSRADTR